ncbi:MAG: LL-diaminopimelate aminotransferase [Kiritimatiellae bacterium]|nr:LL-diaminopimelate aminotransferase [Kiritimatiellia bacterium]
MLHVNENYTKIQASYLFTEIAHRVSAHQAANPDAKIIRLGIGDVTEPLAPAVIKALHKAVDDEATRENFHGYGPEQGYAFLREKAAQIDFQDRGIDIAADEIFISDGAKCDCGNVQELFADDVTIAVGDPVYPVYVDTNVMAGRTGLNVDGRYEGLQYLTCDASNGFVPSPEVLKDFAKKPDLVYLCYPNNPTGAVATLEQLQAWVDWAKTEKSLILFDAAYEAFIRDPKIPHSIYECKGARDCAIEFRSYSKTAGFTGIRCGYTVVPKGLLAYTTDGKGLELRPMWTRRQTTKFNGASYLTQRGAEAIYTPEGRAETKAIIDFYLENASLVKAALRNLGYTVTGGDNSPYLWVNVKGDSWEFFDKLLKGANIVTTPGAGFGRAGEGYIRISAFNSRENVLEAIDRFSKVL